MTRHQHTVAQSHQHDLSRDDRAANVQCAVSPLNLNMTYKRN
jgi:hypothetical protein